MCLQEVLCNTYSTSITPITCVVFVLVKELVLHVDECTIAFYQAIIKGLLTMRQQCYIVFVFGNECHYLPRWGITEFGTEWVNDFIAPAP